MDQDMQFRNQQGDGRNVALVALATVGLLTLSHFIGPVVVGLLVVGVAGAVVGYLWRRH